MRTTQWGGRHKRPSLKRSFSKNKEKLNKRNTNRCLMRHKDRSLQAKLIHLLVTSRRQINSRSVCSLLFCWWTTSTDDLTLQLITQKPTSPGPFFFLSNISNNMYCFSSDRKKNLLHCRTTVQCLFEIRGDCQLGLQHPRTTLAFNENLTLLSWVRHITLSR